MKRCICSLQAKIRGISHDRGEKTVFYDDCCLSSTTTAKRLSGRKSKFLLSPPELQALFR